MNKKSKSIDKVHLNECTSLRPNDLFISDLKWKYLYRSVTKAKNILIIGPTGSGKTFSAHCVAKALNREDNFFYFNLGAMTDARCSLIGNTHFDKNTGTIFDESLFVKAIQTENSIILLDELSRAHYDAVNILMTVLDPLQRYLRIDERKDTATIKVASGVTFVATANIGNEYTATRVMDKALLNRFSVKIEMDFLTKDEEFKLMKDRFDISDENQLELLDNILSIVSHTRDHIKDDESKISYALSTRDVVEMTELIGDGFNLKEISEAVIYPNYSNDGGSESERIYIKQLVQKYLPSEYNEELYSDVKDDNDEPPF